MKSLIEFIEEGKKPGLWDNIHAKRKRIKAGSGEKMRKPGSEGAPTAQDFKNASESIEETKAAPKGYHFTRDGKLKRGDADADGPGGAKLRADPLDKQRSKVPPVSENFMDGKGPGKPGDAAKHGLKGKSKAELQKIRSSDSASPRKKQLAHWMLNMHHNEEAELKELTMVDIKKMLAQPKSKKMVRYYLDLRRKNPGRDQNQLMTQAAKQMGFDLRVGRDVILNTLNKMVKKGQLPKHLAVEENQATLNTIDKAFKEAIPGDIYSGTNKLLKRYKKGTPGQ